MKNTLKHFLGPAVLLLCLLAAGAAGAPGAVRAGDATVPSVITFRGTEFIDCRLDPDYPFAASEETSTLKGVVTEECGSKTYPWFAAVVAGRTLFAAHTKDLIGNYEGMLGRKVESIGYPGAGSIPVYSSIVGDSVQEFPQAFYVSRIKGWLHVRGRAVNSDTGIANENFTYFWIEER